MITQLSIWATIIGSIAAVAVVPTCRNAVLRGWRAPYMKSGLPHRRYAKRFISRWGTYEIPYLQEYEKLDLLSTYVPLSFQAGYRQDLTLANKVLKDLPADRMVIVGDPGSGKSTLLRAYGAGILRGWRIGSPAPKVVPYYVQLRQLARFVSSGRGLSDYIVDELLVRGGAFSPSRAAEFFGYTLERRQAVVMLDGLDEVPDERQHDVLAAVRAFMGDHTQDRPSAKARIILTCRTQNFENLRDNWIDAFAKPRFTYTLASLRDHEIISYLQRLQDKFSSAEGPSRFMKSVRDAGTLDLLRTPLILAMSVGLYARRPTMIPTTIAELYDNMIREMLDRNSFRHEDSDNSLLRYRVSDKYSFLRQFAFHSVTSSGEFGEFSSRELVDLAERLSGDLEAVDSPAGLVREIIWRSGLLTPVGGGLYKFAHRSIQEFLASQELRQLPDGEDFLLMVANELNWRQTIEFFTAGQEPRHVDGFLRNLVKRNPELAAHCLQAAKPSDATARLVLDGLGLVSGSGLSALAAAARSPRLSIQNMAIQRFKLLISESGWTFSGGTSVEEILPLLESLVDTNAAEIAALVPNAVKHVPDDPRLVGPLWRCLGASGIEFYKTECKQIVLRLLTMAVNLDAFNELAGQDPHDHDYIFRLRQRAYPFEHALPRTHNMVTLLSWAEYLELTPVQLNRFFEAKAARSLSRLETDRRWAVSHSLWPFGRTLSSLIYYGGLIALVISIASQAAQPSAYSTAADWGGAIALIAFAFAPLMLYFLITSTASEGSLLSAAPAEITGNLPRYLQSRLVSISHPVPVSSRGAILAALAFCGIALAFPTDSGFVRVMVVFCCGILYWMTDMTIFSRDRHYYIYTPSEFVDVYDDPRSRHWLGLFTPSLQPVGD